MDEIKNNSLDMTAELTIVIPIRIDSIERKENLDTVLSYLSKNTQAEIIILEADSKQRYMHTKSAKRVKYLFIEDNDPIFHRTRYLNVLLGMSETEIVGIWDSDVIMDRNQIHGAVKAIKEGTTLCYPYDGGFKYLGIKQSQEVREDVASFLAEWNRGEEIFQFGRPSVGGAFIVNKQRYLHAGGENENFYGWGPEDAERYKRMEIMEEPISRIDGSLFHLHHPRGINSGFDHSLKDLHCLKELLHVCKMDKTQLIEYINSEEWNRLASRKRKVRNENSLSTPLVSVIMPVYNGEEYVKNAIESILRQTYAGFELIIINDGSIDSTAILINNFNDERIVFVDHSVNKGNYWRRNEGTGLAKGKYIAVMDADDEASPFRLESQVSYMEKNSHILAVGSQFELEGKGISNKPTDYDLIKVMLLQNNMFLHPSLLIRKSVLEEIGGYDEQYYYASDYDLVCRLSLKGEVVNMPDVLMKYRLHGTQISCLRNKEQKQYADMIRINYLRNLGFILSATGEILFNRIMNYEGTVRREDLTAVMDMILEQNENGSFLEKNNLKSLIKGVDYLKIDL